jgi:hypothetical protein
MRISRLCVVAGLLAPALACRADPTMDIAPGSATSLSGKVRVTGRLGGAKSLSGAAVYMTFDPTWEAVSNAESSFTPGPGWQTAAYNVVGNEAL